jgi:hypothetical protein
VIGDLGEELKSDPFIRSRWNAGVYLSHYMNLVHPKIGFPFSAANFCMMVVFISAENLL